MDKAKPDLFGSGMLYFNHMFLNNSQDVLLLVAAFCLFAVSFFVCWLLYEAARLLQQTNALVEDTRNKITIVENMVAGFGEKLGNLTQYVGFIAEGGKKVMSYLDHSQEHEVKKTKKAKGDEPTLDELEEEGA